MNYQNLVSVLSASADNTDLGFDNSWYHAQPNPIIVYYRRSSPVRSPAGSLCWTGFISSLFSHYHRYYIIVIFTFVTPNTPLPSPPKRKTKSCISIVFVLPWDVRLWYCDTQDNLKIFRFFFFFFWWRMNYGQRQSGEFSLPKPQALWLLITRRFSEFVSHAQSNKNYSGVENALLHNQCKFCSVMGRLIP